MHAGIDIGSARRGDEPVYAVKGGTVVMVAENTPTSNMMGYGNAVVIRHDGGRFALYAHLKDGSVVVTPGQRLVGGQRIGIMGNTTNGNFSPLPGESVETWQRRARARGYNSGPMVRHLHFELRQARPDGSSPFPGPYPRSPDQAQFNLDPMPWFNEQGLIFSSRGAARFNPGASMSRHNLSPEMAGYEPPEFDVDPRWGLTKTERILLVTGGVALTGTLLVLLVRSRLSPNRRRRGGAA